MAVHYKNKVCGWSGLIVLRYPGSGVLVPCRHSWIFVAAQVWHEMSQAFVLGHSFEQLAWQEQVGPASSGLQVLQMQQVWAASCAGHGNAGCATEKQCLVRACGVAVGPLGTVSTSLTLHSQRCLHVQQYVEPLLVHT